MKFSKFWAIAVVGGLAVFAGRASAADSPATQPSTQSTVAQTTATLGDLELRANQDMAKGDYAVRSRCFRKCRSS